MLQLFPEIEVAMELHDHFPKVVRKVRTVEMVVCKYN